MIQVDFCYADTLMMPSPITSTHFKPDEKSMFEFIRDTFMCDDAHIAWATLHLSDGTKERIHTIFDAIRVLLPHKWDSDRQWVKQ